MVIGQWTYKLAGNIQKAIDGYKIIEKHFSNHGAIGSALVSSHGTDTGTFSTMIGYENYEQFGLIDYKIIQDENFNNEMNPYFEITSWEKMNFAEPMMHKMEPDPGVKNCFAAWTFHHKNIDMIMKKSEIFFKLWMDAGANGCSVGRYNGHDSGYYSFASRFQSMTDYGKAQDKLNSENVWADHTDFTDDVTWKSFNLVRVIETNWD